MCLSLLSVATGIALFGAGDPPTGAPVPPVAVVFVAAGVLFWVVASMEYVETDPSRL
ncbi:DUF202 domain-containing protein [Natronomonas sp.]|uniref:DUF202 domain-containing protein n=1 Tax=Natronomonas sp. TaxID=2184060 RepID=UPI002615174E|nr:DUF202 domain-containing protein [Natronomonas sp.]